MNYLNIIVQTIDNIQRRSRFLAFTYAVIKKYSEDRTGYQAALLTYYGFLALFPLLLVVTTLTSILAANHPVQQAKIITAMTDYFPVLGHQLSEHVTTFHTSGWALAVGIIFTIYGARGVADVFRLGVNYIWDEPEAGRLAFPKSLIKNFSLMFVGGLGLIVAAIITGIASSAGQGVAFRVLSVVINFGLLYSLFAFLINASLPRHVSLKHIWKGAAAAAIGLIILQSLGGYVLKSEFKSLDALYSYFAVALGILFWIYLQAQVLYYSVTIAAVDAHMLWPRSLAGSNKTAADKKLGR